MPVQKYGVAMGKPDLSVIIPSHNEGKDVIATVDCLLRNTTANLQLIVVDDSSTDESVPVLKQWAAQGNIELIRGHQLGAINARNRGAAIAKADIIGFIDGHCFAPKGWDTPLLEAFERSPDTAAASPAIGAMDQHMIKGYGATWEDDDLAMRWLPRVDEIAEVPFIGGAATFVRKPIFNALHGFDQGIIQWGYEDVEFSIRLWLFGYRVVVVPNSTIFHKFRTHFRYDLDFVQVHYNKLRLIFLHFDGERLRRLLHFHLQFPGAEKSLAMVYSERNTARREQLFATRRQSMDAFCDRFGLLC